MERVDVSILSTGHDVADGRLHRLVHSLLAAGLSVEVRALGSPRHAPPGALVLTATRGGHLGRLLDGWRTSWRARGRVLMVLDPDLVVPARMVSLLRALGGRPGRVVSDVHEDYRSVLADRSWARGWRRLAAGIAVRWWLRAAAGSDLCVVADHHVPPLRARRRMVVTNQPVRAMFATVAVPDRSAHRAVYIGDVRRSRGLFEMLALIERCPDWTLDVVGPIAPGDRDRVTDWIGQSPAAARTTFHGRLDPRRARRIAAGASVGLSLLAPTPAFVAALPTKILEYHSYGLATLTSPLPRAAQLVRDSGGGLVVETIDDAVAALRTWQQDPAALTACRRLAIDWAVRSLDPDPYRELAAAVAGLAAHRPPRPGSTDAEFAIDRSADVPRAF